MIVTATVSLLLTREDSSKIEALEVEPYLSDKSIPVTLVVDNSPTTKIYFFASKEDALEIPDESSLEAVVNAKLVEVGDWLLENWEKMLSLKRDKSLEFLFFIDLWIDGDQMEVEFPVNLLLACGKIGTKIYVLSNG